MKNQQLAHLKTHLIWVEVNIESLKTVQVTRPNKRTAAVAKALAEALVERRELRQIIKACGAMR